MADVAKKWIPGQGVWSDGTQVKPGSALVFGAATGQWTLARAPKWYNTNNSADDGSDHQRPRPWSSTGGGGGNLRWKPRSTDGRLAVLVSGGRGGTLTVNGVQGTYIGQTNGNRATYRFPKVGGAYGTNIKVVYSNGGTWTIPNGASDLHNVKSQSAKAPGKTTWTMGSEKMGTRTDLQMHHWNWRGNPGPSALVMAYGGSTNGAEWVEVSGHRMSKHGSGDKGRDVWTMGTLKGTGAVHGRIMLRGKIYTFTIPRGKRLVYEINLHGGGESSSKPTNKPTSKPSGVVGSKNLYGQEHGGDEGGTEGWDMVDVNGVKVRRGFTTYNGKVMTFAAAERAKQLAAALAGDFPESSDLLGGGQVSGNPADTGFATGNPADEGYTGGAGPG